MDASYSECFLPQILCNDLAPSQSLPHDKGRARKVDPCSANDSSHQLGDTGIQAHKPTIHALHKRLPLEIWSQIFFYCLEQPVAVIFKNPQLTEAPWLLGRVCSTWRQFSRADKRLWPPVEISIWSPQQSSILARACEILPAFAPVHVILREAKKVFVPYRRLWRAQKLTILLDRSGMADNLDQMFKSASDFDNYFSNIQELTIDMYLSSQISEKIISSWNSLTPFKNAHRLEIFNLTMSHRLLPFVSLHLPWSRLHFMDLRGPLDDDLGAFADVLRQCSVLQELKLYFTSISPMKIAPDPSPVAIPSQLKKLTLGGHVSPVFTRCLVGLTDLDALTLNSFHADSDVLYDVLLSCGEQLTSLNLNIPAMPPTRTHLNTLHMPRLLELNLHDVKGDWLFRLLRPYFLERFISTQQLDLATICRIIAPSAPSIFSFSLHLHGTEDLSILSEFSSELSMVAEVEITGAIMTEDWMKGIATGTLFPNLKYLRLRVPNDTAFLRVVEARANIESRHKRKTTSKSSRSGF